jgi:hypothetical protein
MAPSVRRRLYDDGYAAAKAALAAMPVAQAV